LISDSASGEAIVGAGSDAAAIETSGMPEHLSRRADFLQQLQRGDVDIVVTTESTARGLDLPGTLLCVLCVMPYQPRDYVHLAGRVGRSHTVTEGAISQLTTLPGICVSLVSDRELHRCIPRHALSLQLDFESWSISANESKSARPGRDAAALISAAQQPLVQPQLVPSFLHLMRSALLPNASRLVEAATSMSNVKQSGSSAPSLRKLLMR
jgi:superfamily II DNA/RNA helicase